MIRSGRQELSWLGRCRLADVEEPARRRLNWRALRVGCVAAMVLLGVASIAVGAWISRSHWNSPLVSWDGGLDTMASSLAGFTVGHVDVIETPNEYRVVWRSGIESRRSQPVAASERMPVGWLWGLIRGRSQLYIARGTSTRFWRLSIDYEVFYIFGGTMVGLGLFGVLLETAWRYQPPSLRRPRCARCRYDLRGIAHDKPCPECGLERTNSVVG